MPFSPGLIRQSTSAGPLPYFVPDSQHVVHRADKKADVCVRFFTKAAPKVYWYRNCVPLKDTENYTVGWKEDGRPGYYQALLSFIKVDVKYGDNYEVQVVNEFGSAKTEIRIDCTSEEDLPAIIQNPTIQYVGDGKVRMYAKFRSPAFKQILWRRFKHGKEVQVKMDDFDYMVQEFESGMFAMTITSNRVQEKESGIWRCDVIDTKGHLKLAFPLMYAGEPNSKLCPQVISNPGLRLLKSNAIVMTLAVKSAQAPEVVWVQPNMKPLQLPNRNMDCTVTPLVGFFDCGYLIRFVIESWIHAKSGIYMCLVKNSNGTLEVPYKVDLDPEYQKTKKKEAKKEAKRRLKEAEARKIKF